MLSHQRSREIFDRLPIGLTQLLYMQGEQCPPCRYSWSLRGQFV
jgi:hypothetical protein